MGSKSSEPGSAGTGSGVAGEKTDLGGSSNVGGATADPRPSCKTFRDEAPGTPIHDLSQPGQGPCQGVTLGQTIDRIHTEYPGLSDIETLYRPDPERVGDGSFIYAFQRPDGTFALVFKRGGGDCPSGCIENDYWYFETVDECGIALVGTTRRYSDGQCLPPDQLPMWGIPSAAPPESVCDANNDPEDLSGDHVLYLCGQGSQCATSSQGSKPTTLPNVVTVHIVQSSADLAHGTVTLSGTGEPLLDGRELTAQFKRRQFHVEEHVSNLPSNCIEQHDITLDYDFEGFRQGHLSFFQTATPDCDGNPGDYCKGGIEADLGRELE